jgi:CTP synthase
VPYLRTSGELKSKPSQHSVQKLREIGIQPDILICRTEKPLPEELKAKLSLFCNVGRQQVIEEQDVPTSIYELPQMLAEQGLDRLILQRLGLAVTDLHVERYSALLQRIRNPRRQVELALVGKYIELTDAYKSVYEAVAHGGFASESKVRVRRILSENVTSQNAAELLGGVHGIIVPGGFGGRGIEGKIETVRYARERGIPYLGLCLGMQVMVIEFARHVAGMERANSTEFDPETPFPVIDLMPDQRGLDKGGTMRLGAYRCALRAGTLARIAYGDEMVSERHRHRYELNNSYRERLEASGLVVAGTNPERELVEIVELRNHPFMVGVQFHPEFKSKPTRPHPLIRDLVAAALRHSEDVPPPESEQQATLPLTQDARAQQQQSDDQPA